MCRKFASVFDSFNHKAVVADRILFILNADIKRTYDMDEISTLTKIFVADIMNLS